MTDHHHTDPDAARPADTTDSPTDPQSRARALQSLLIEKELLTTDAIDRIIRMYEEDIGPQHGARVVARAWTDPDYRDRLLTDGTPVIAEVAPVNDDVADITVVANTPTTHNVVVCTLCSCYPWAVLGLPPTWYKSPEYRSRIVKHPRDTLRDAFDLVLPPDVDITVWDSTSEKRYMVLPQRPPDTHDLDEPDLAALVTRDAMIGVSRLTHPHA